MANINIVSTTAIIRIIRILIIIIVITSTMGPLSLLQYNSVRSSQMG